MFPLEKVMLGGFTERDVTEHLALKYERYLSVSLTRYSYYLLFSCALKQICLGEKKKVVYRASNYKWPSLFSGNPKTEWPKFLSELFGNFPKRNVVLSVGTVKCYRFFF